MQTIWKFPLKLRPTQIIKERGLVKLLHLGIDPQGVICLWGVVDFSDNTTRRWSLALVGTGNTIPDAMSSDDYIGTVLKEEFVWHMFAKALNA